MERAQFGNDVWPTFCKLWPSVAKRLTDEQRDAWHRAAGNHSVANAVNALRKVYDDGPRFPEPAMLRAKLGAITGGNPRNETWTDTKTREEFDRLQHSIAQAVDGMTDEELAGHALMHAASDPRLLWTLRQNPRRSVGMRNVIHYRAMAGLGPDDPTGIRPSHNGPPEIWTIPPESIERARQERIKPTTGTGPLGFVRPALGADQRLWGA